MTFKKGTSGNVRGRPKGIPDKRSRLNHALMGNADALLAVATSKALEGDPQMLSTLLARVMPTLRPEGTKVRFEIDTSLPASKQIEQLIQAVANEQLTIEQAAEMAAVVHRMGDARSIEGSGDAAERLAASFKELAKHVDGPWSAPGEHPGFEMPEAPPTVEPNPAAPKATGAPRAWPPTR